MRIFVKIIMSQVLKINLSQNNFSFFEILYFEVHYFAIRSHYFESFWLWLLTWPFFFLIITFAELVVHIIAILLVLQSDSLFRPKATAAPCSLPTHDDSGRGAEESLKCRFCSWSHSSVCQSCLYYMHLGLCTLWCRSVAI